MFIWILIGLFCVSILLSVFSLWKDLKKNIKTDVVTEELSKGRVIFHAPSASEMQGHMDVSSNNIERNEPVIPTMPETHDVSPHDHAIVQEHIATSEPVDTQEKEIIKTAPEPSSSQLYSPSVINESKVEEAIKPEITEEVQSTET